MTTKTPDQDSDDMSLAEVNDTLHEIIRSLKFHEAMVTDLLAMMTELDPVSINRLRVQAAIALNKVHADRYTDPLADERESYWRHRFVMLDTVLARTGSYFKTAEVVTLDAARQS